MHKHSGFAILGVVVTITTMLSLMPGAHAASWRVAIVDDGTPASRDFGDGLRLGLQWASTANGSDMRGDALSTVAFNSSSSLPTASDVIASVEWRMLDDTSVLAASTAQGMACFTGTTDAVKRPAANASIANAVRFQAQATERQATFSTAIARIVGSSPSACVLAANIPTLSTSCRVMYNPSQTREFADAVNNDLTLRILIAICDAACVNQVLQYVGVSKNPVKRQLIVSSSSTDLSLVTNAAIYANVVSVITVDGLPPPSTIIRSDGVATQIEPTRSLIVAAYTAGINTRFHTSRGFMIGSAIAVAYSRLPTAQRNRAGFVANTVGKFRLPLDYDDNGPALTGLGGACRDAPDKGYVWVMRPDPNSSGGGTWQTALEGATTGASVIVTLRQRSCGPTLTNFASVKPAVITSRITAPVPAALHSAVIQQLETAGVAVMLADATDSVIGSAYAIREKAAQVPSAVAVVGTVGLKLTGYLAGLSSNPIPLVGAFDVEMAVPTTNAPFDTRQLLYIMPTMAWQLAAIVGLAARTHQQIVAVTGTQTPENELCVSTLEGYIGATRQRGIGTVQLRMWYRVEEQARVSFDDIFEQCRDCLLLPLFTHDSIATGALIDSWIARATANTTMASLVLRNADYMYAVSATNTTPALQARILSATVPELGATVPEMIETFAAVVASRLAKNPTATRSVFVQNWYDQGTFTVTTASGIVRTVGRFDDPASSGRELCNVPGSAITIGGVETAIVNCDAVPAVSRADVAAGAKIDVTSTHTKAKVPAYGVALIVLGSIFTLIALAVGFGVWSSKRLEEGHAHDNAADPAAAEGLDEDEEGDLDVPAIQEDTTEVRSRSGRDDGTQSSSSPQTAGSGAGGGGGTTTISDEDGRSHHSHVAPASSGGDTSEARKQLRLLKNNQQSAIENDLDQADTGDGGELYQSLVRPITVVTGRILGVSVRNLVLILSFFPSLVIVAMCIGLQVDLSKRMPGSKFIDGLAEISAELLDCSDALANDMVRQYTLTPDFALLQPSARNNVSTFLAGRTTSPAICEVAMLKVHRSNDVVKARLAPAIDALSQLLAYGTDLKSSATSTAFVGITSVLYAAATQSQEGAFDIDIAAGFGFASMAVMQLWFASIQARTQASSTNLTTGKLVFDARSLSNTLQFLRYREASITNISIEAVAAAATVYDEAVVTWCINRCVDVAAELRTKASQHLQNAKRLSHARYDFVAMIAVALVLALVVPPMTIILLAYLQKRAEDSVNAEIAATEEDRVVAAQLVPALQLAQLGYVNIHEVPKGAVMEQKLAVASHEFGHNSATAFTDAVEEEFEFYSAHTESLDALLSRTDTGLDRFVCGDAVVVLFANADHAVHFVTQLLVRVRRANIRRRAAGDRRDSSEGVQLLSDKKQEGDWLMHASVHYGVVKTAIVDVQRQLTLHRGGCVMHEARYVQAHARRIGSSFLITEAARAAMQISSTECRPIGILPPLFPSSAHTEPVVEKPRERRPSFYQDGDQNSRPDDNDKRSQATVTTTNATNVESPGSVDASPDAESVWSEGIKVYDVFQTEDIEVKIQRRSSRRMLERYFKHVAEDRAASPEGGDTPTRTLRYLKEAQRGAELASIVDLPLQALYKSVTNASSAFVAFGGDGGYTLMVSASGWAAAGGGVSPSSRTKQLVARGHNRPESIFVTHGDGKAPDSPVEQSPLLTDRTKPRANSTAFELLSKDSFKITQTSPTPNTNNLDHQSAPPNVVDYPPLVELDHPHMVPEPEEDRSVATTDAAPFASSSPPPAGNAPSGMEADVQRSGEDPREGEEGGDPVMRESWKQSLTDTTGTSSSTPKRTKSSSRSKDKKEKKDKSGGKSRANSGSQRTDTSDRSSSNGGMGTLAGLPVIPDRQSKA
jgi:hypothetical protein